MKGNLQIFWAFLIKELQLILFGSGFFWVSLIFSVGLFMLFRFTLPAEKLDIDASISFLWGIHLISSLFSLLAQQEWEWEWGAYRAIKLSGIPGPVIFLSKSLAAFLTLGFLWLVELMVWSLFFAMLLVPNPAPALAETVQMYLQLIVAGLLVSLGISFLGQLTAVLALHSRYRHALLLIVFFPLSLPLLISASSYSRMAWQLKDWLEIQGQLNMVIAFSFIFLAAGLALFDFLWEE